MTIIQKLTLVQGIYFLLTGLWPIFNIESFLFVSGHKTDLWLVKTVGVLISVIAIVLLINIRSAASLQNIVLAVLSAFSLGSIDVIYVTKKTISPIYFMDACIEFFLVISWLIAIR
jgi:hypothetical protein